MKNKLRIQRAEKFPLEMADQKVMSYKSGKGVLHWFLNSTSVGGLSQSNSSELKLSKFCWIVLFIIGMSLTFWNLDNVVKDYMRRPVTF